MYSLRDVFTWVSQDLAMALEASLHDNDMDDEDLNLALRESLKLSGPLSISVEAPYVDDLPEVPPEETQNITPTIRLSLSNRPSIHIPEDNREGDVEDALTLSLVDESVWRETSEDWRTGTGTVVIMPPDTVVQPFPSVSSSNDTSNDHALALTLQNILQENDEHEAVLPIASQPSSARSRSGSRASIREQSEYANLSHGSIISFGSCLNVYIVFFIFQDTLMTMTTSWWLFRRDIRK
jgi:hypothetical protein